MKKAKNEIAPRRTAADIMAMEDRPTFTVEVPEWGLVGDNAAICKQPDAFTIAKIVESCEASAMGMCRRAAMMIVEGCIDPKFGPEHIDALTTAKSANAVATLAAAITLGPKKNAVLKK